MFKQASDRDHLQRYVEAVRHQFGAPELQGAVTQAAAGAGAGVDGDPVETLRSAIPDVAGDLASSGGRQTANVPYLSRDPIQSLLQSTIEEKLRQAGVPDQPSGLGDVFETIVHTVKSLLHTRRFGPDDPDWVIDVGKSMLDRLAAGNHQFNPSAARREIEDTSRIVVVGDWGTGLPRAKAVAGFMAEEVADALGNGRQAHVIHLGDVYYSGTPEEVDRHVLAPGLWPVTVDQARHGVTSWSLNGNHDMYGGGYGYYDRLLADERFSAQRSPDDKTTSVFELVAPSWQFVGLDTSWDPDVLAQGHQAVLEDPQAEIAVKAAAEAREAGRKLILLSHHQLDSVYDKPDIGTVLTSKLGPILNGDNVTAWLWGHEHRCMGFEPISGINFVRCIGHGGVPVLMEHAANDPIPSPGAWEEREFVKQRGDRWQRFGFAVLDMASDRIDVRYRDELGRQSRAETIR